MSTESVSNEARWKGKSVESMTKEELIEAMGEMARGYEDRLRHKDEMIDLLMQREGAR